MAASSSQIKNIYPAFFCLFVLMFLLYITFKITVGPQYLHIYNAQSDIRTDEREVAS